MYQQLLDDQDAELNDGTLYLSSSPDISMIDEIRLARSRLAGAVQSGDDKAMQTWLSLLHALIRVQSGLESSVAAGERDELLARVADEIIGDAESVVGSR